MSTERQTAPSQPSPVEKGRHGPHGPHGPHPLPRWVPIRSLGRRHAERVAAHLLALSDADRLLRFGHMVSDDGLRAYVAQIDFDRDKVFGVFNRKLALVAVAHLAFDNTRQLPGGVAEFGVSVDAAMRGRGLGARLFDHAVVHARNRGVGTLLIHMARDNVAMRRIVHRAGATLRFEGTEGLAQLPLPADTLGSQIEEMLGHQAAEFDYRLKQQALRLGGLQGG